MNPKQKNKYILYLLVRNDLPSLNAGKAMAQAAHAANSLTAEWGADDAVKEYSNRKHQFGTCIVLGVDKRTLVSRLKKAQSLDWAIPWGPVCGQDISIQYHYRNCCTYSQESHDGSTILKEESRVVLFRRELTCGYMLVADGSNDQKTLVSDLSLYQ